MLPLTAAEKLLPSPTSAFIHYSRKEYQLGAGLYGQALTITREIDDRADEGVILNNIGQLFSDQQEPDKAADYFTQALQVDRALGNRLAEGTVLSNIGSIYSDKGQSDKALTQFQQALTIFREFGRPQERRHRAR